MNETKKKIEPLNYWILSSNELIKTLQSNLEGLSEIEAKKRLQVNGLNTLRHLQSNSTWMLFAAQFKSPITIILLLAAMLSFYLGETTNACIIFFILFSSALLSFWQEKGASDALKHLTGLVRIKTNVVRSGTVAEIPVEEIVTGDIVSLSAGDLVPGDCLIMEARDLFANEASLTGETFPVDKIPGVLPTDTPLARRTNSLYMGTYISSGAVKALVYATGKETEFGKIAKQLSNTPPETDFEMGIRKFGYLLIEVTLLLVLTIFAINMYFHRPVIDSLLFSLALAVGLTPQLLPAIISVNLAHGAKIIAKSKVIVKRLSSIENLGSMNILCSDKTGTLTEGKVEIKDFTDMNGTKSEKLLLYCYLNAFFETGFKNPIDAAILRHTKPDIKAYTKCDEIPYDFIRKKLSILVNSVSGHQLIVKGAFQNILDACSSLEHADGTIQLIGSEKANILHHYEALGQEGLRVIGVAYKNMGSQNKIDKDSENELTFLGFITLYDPLKKDINNTIHALNELGISLKIITGDNPFIARKVGQSIFEREVRMITGSELRLMSNDAFLQQVNDIDVFSEIEPNQKEKILFNLKKKGNVVGYLGDGINDASALKTADVGISVDTAADVAKDAADIVLLEKDLQVLIAGVREGRRTFANTMKYVLMATSANFGNMFSMAGASIFLSFLPLLPGQILTTNFLTDLPEMTIAKDAVDEERIRMPQKWDLGFIKRFMLTFGLLSAVFDFLTFALLLWWVKADIMTFRTGWFIESVVSASLIVLVVRTRKSILQSRPSKYLVLAVIGTIVLTILLPFSPLADIMGFTPLPFTTFLALGFIVVLYIVATEILKVYFYRKYAGTANGR